MAAARPELKAVVVYYGLQIPADQVPAVQAPLLLHYAELDQRVNAGIAAYESALKANGKRYTIYMYPGVNHAFNNDTGGRATTRRPPTSRGSGRWRSLRSISARRPAPPEPHHKPD